MSRPRATSDPSSIRYSAVYERKRGWAPLNLRELWNFRELLYFLAWRDIKVRYKQAILGIGWVVLQPILMTGVFTVVFNVVLKIEGPEGLPYVVFVLSGLVVWQYFAAALSRCGVSLVGNSSILTKVYFPRLVVPIAPIFAGLVDLVIGLVILGGLMAVYGIVPGWGTVFLPLLIILAMGTALSVGLWLSALYVLYRDVQYIIPFLIQIWMYVSPVIYPLDSIDNAALRVIFSLNPMTGVIDGFRWALLGQRHPGSFLWVSVAIVIVLMVGGLYYFKRVEHVFADVI